MTSTKNSILRFTISIGFAAGITLAGCSKKGTTASAPPVVEVTRAEAQDVPIYHDWIGTLDGLVNAQIRAQVAGYLLSQNYREGDRVKKDELLFQIDERPFRAVLNQAEAKLAQDKAQQSKAQWDVERYAPLAKQDAISQQEYKDALMANLAAQAQVKADEAAVESADLNLQFTRIISPISGIAGIATAQIGDLVGPSTGLLTTVSEMDPIKLYYNVTEQAYINYTSIFTDEVERTEHTRQLELQLILADGTIYPHEGRVYAVDRQINTTTGALRVEARFDNPGYVLRPGQFARVRVKFDVRKGAILVPQRAVSELQGSYQVAVVDSTNTAHIRPVKVGERSGSSWIIEEGLKAGEIVVVEGLQKAREGTRVDPKPYEPAKKAGA